MTSGHHTEHHRTGLCYSSSCFSHIQFYFIPFIMLSMVTASHKDRASEAWELFILLLVLVCPGSQAASCFYPGNCHTGHPQALKQTGSTADPPWGSHPDHLQQPDQRCAGQTPITNIILGN